MDEHRGSPGADAAPAFTFPVSVHAPSNSTSTVVSMSSLLSGVETPPSHGAAEPHRPSITTPPPPPPPPPFSASRSILNESSSPAVYMPPLPAPARSVAPSFSRGGLSSLMNSPMADPASPASPAIPPPMAPSPAQPTETTDGMAVQAQPQQQLAPSEPAVVADTNAVVAAVDSPTGDVPADATVEVRVHAIVLSDKELEALKHEFIAVLQKQWQADGKADAGAPASKRQKKSRHQQRRLKDASVQQDLDKCVDHLDRKVRFECYSTSFLADAMRLCLALCVLLHEKDPLPATDGTAPATMSFDATLAAVQQRSVYSQLMGVVRRAILGAPEEAKSVLLTQLLEWCTEVAPEPASQWLWTFVFVAQLDSFLVQDFLMRQALVRPSSAVSLDAPLQYLATAHPAQTVDIVRDLLEELAANSVQHVDNQPVNVVLSNLITFVARSDATVRACGDSVQWIVTSELIRQLWLNLHQLSDSSSAMEVESHGHASRPSQRSMGALLLDCIARQSSNLGSGAFHLVLLLQSLQKQIPSGDISASNSDLPARAAQFHRQLQDAAEKEESKALVTSIYRFLPYVCRSVVRQLHNADVSDHEQAAVEHWTRWLVIMAARVSRSAIVQALVEAELMISEVPSDHTRQGDSSTDSALCDLLTHVIGSTTSEYTAFITSLMELCRTSPSARRQCRLLELLRSLLAANKTEALPSKHHDTTLLPMQMATLGADVDDAAALVQRLTLAQPWETSWATFESWKTTSGAAFWSSLLDLACSSDDGVASQALELLASTPFASLEDPVWQYQCLHKLTLVFFHLLRRFRMELVQCAASTSPSTPSTTALEQLHGRLEVLKVLFARLVAVDGGVTHYPSSVFAVFVALWLDLLLSTTSPTSIPTHFPNRVNFDDAPGAGIYARHVIRAERTVSSKCTNLQASKVITHVPETLVYRKALDATWGHEMDAATTCGVYVVDLLVRLLRTHHQAPVAANDGTSANNADQHLERRTKAIVDLLLERAIPCCGLQSDDAYKETLPNRSTFDMDLRIEQWLHHFPAFLPLLRAVVETSAALQLTQAWRLLPLLKSALVVLLGHWNSVKGGLEHDNMDVPPYMRNRNQLRLTTELVRILGLTGWLPTSLANTADLLPLTTPADIRAILFSCWSFLADHPPSKNAAIGSSSHINGIAPAALDGFLIPVRKALHRNIRRVGARYPQFMC